MSNGADKLGDRRTDGQTQATTITWNPEAKTRVLGYKSVTSTESKDPWDLWDLLISPSTPPPPPPPPHTHIDILSCVTLKFYGWRWKTIWHLFYAISSFVHHFIAISELKLELQPRNAQSRSKLAIFVSRVTLTFDRWPWKTIGILFYATWSFMHNFIAIGDFQVEFKSKKGQSGSRLKIFLSWVTLIFDRWPWKTKNYMAPLLSHIKVCALFHHHVWIQTGVTVQKPLNLVLTSVTLTFDLLHGHHFYQ